MNSLLQSLREDHTNLERLLKLLDRKVDELAEGDDAAVETLSAIGAYCLDYPGLSHHPAEEVIATHLHRKSPQVAEAIGDIEREHAELAAATRDYVATVAALGAETVLPRQQVVEELRGFAQRYRQHIEWEEAELFPAAEQCLDDSDWAVLIERVGPRTDPLLSDDVRSSYRVIREALLSGE